MGTYNIQRHQSKFYALRMHHNDCSKPEKTDRFQGNHPRTYKDSQSEIKECRWGTAGCKRIGSWKRRHHNKHKSYRGTQENQVHQRNEFLHYQDPSKLSSKWRNCDFLKGVRWSPDGTCLMTASEDKKIRQKFRILD